MSNGIGRDSLRNFPINLQKDSLLEAKDAYGTWYPAKVREIKDGKVHIHFCNWSSRYDTWYPITSDCLRALKRISTSTSSSITKVPNTQDDRAIPAEKAPKTAAPINYELGSYVMASWKNEYEYLAEVIAHRHRQGDKSEYRLRYIWDNVIEWTPLHRIRKATQFEIDYVLKFCREHASSGLGKRSSDGHLKSEPRESRRRKASEDKFNQSTDTPSLTTLTEVKGKEYGHKDDCVAPASRSAAHTPHSNGSSSTEQKTTPIGSPCFDGIEQDDMVYDKTVLQFHEACRKRRELKRQAIETNHQPVVKSEVSSPRTNEPAPEALKSQPGNRTPKPSSPEPDIKPPKVARLAEPTTVPTKCSPKPCSPLETTCVEPDASSLIETTPDNVETACVAPVNSPLVTVPASPPLTSPVKKSPSTIPLPAPPVSPVKKTIDSPRPKIETETKAIPPVAKQAQQPTTAPTKSSPPVIYPCPYCPRQLRHSKLLAAHISNYHKDVAHPSNSTRRTTTKASRIARFSPKKPETCFATERTQPTNTTPSSPTIPVATPSGTVKTAPKSPEPVKPMRLLSCIRCDSRWNVNDNYPGLIQCTSCLCWMHETCYDLTSTKGSSGRRHFLCDGCLLKTRPARQSRMDEARLSAGRGDDFPWQFTKDESTVRKLMSETSDILHWSYQLRPLVDTGWNILNGTKLPSPPLRDPVVAIQRLTVPQENGKDHPADKKLEEPSSRLPDSHETSANEEHVNRLYMALRESLVDGGPEPQPSRRSLSNSLSDEPPFPSSLPDSEGPTSCWPLADEVEASIVDPHLSQQVLSGFLQELGPNVISEFVDLGTDSATGDVEAADVSYFLPRNSMDKSIPSGPQSDLGSLPTSTTETPTKGLGSLLSSPSGVTSLLQATVSCALPPNNRFDLAPPQNVVVDAASPPSPSVSPRAPSTDLGFSSQTLSEQCLPEKLNNSPRSPTPVKSMDISSGSGNATSNPNITEFIDNPLLNVSTSGGSLQPTEPLPTPIQLSSSTPASHGSELPSDHPGVCSTTSTHLVTTDVDWLAVTTVANGPYQSPFAASMLPKKACMKESLCNPAMIYDTLGSSATFSLDAITDTLTPEDVSQAHMDLDHLDQFILTPLERTLSIMESHLDSVTEQLLTLEQGIDWSTSTKLLGNARHAFDADETEISDYYIPSSDTSSAFGSSPSLSLSPAGIHEDFISGMNQFGPRSALTDRCTKQAARQLYRFVALQRSADAPPCMNKQGSSPESKSNSLFSRRLPPSTVRLLDNHL